VLPQLLHNLLEYTIQHTMYLSSRGVISNVSRPMSNVSQRCHQPLTLHTSPWLRNLEPIYYPFSYQLTDWFCSEGQHHLFPFHLLALPFGAWANVLSTTISFAVISTSFINEECLTTLSRLV